MKQRLYISGYTQPPIAQGDQPEGVFLCEMDENGRLALLQSVEAGPNPSFLALHPDGGALYCTNEQSDGAVTALRLDPHTGRMEVLNRVPVAGADPCYVSLDPSGRWVMAACYSSGSLAVLPAREDGSLGPLAQRVEHHGSGPHPERQDKAYAHCIRFDPSERYVFVLDLGMDRVWVYQMDSDSGALSPLDPPGLQVSPGAGPRHIAYHPGGRVVYVANELDSTVTACAWDDATGRLAAMQTFSTLRPDFSGENTVADIHLTTVGDFLYVSNRGEDSLAAFAVNGSNGELTPLGSYPSGGRTPRNFAISPDGAYLLAAHQDSNSVVVHHVREDGSLEETGQRLALQAPVCVVFA
jgi:6-phosphogluconolactonase